MGRYPELVGIASSGKSALISGLATSASSAPFSEPWKAQHG